MIQDHHLWPIQSPAQTSEYLLKINYFCQVELKIMLMVLPKFLSSGSLLLLGLGIEHMGLMTG